MPVPTHILRRARLFIDAQHGLCNRLRAIASAAAIARRTERQLVVIWRPDHHCEARLSDLLDYRGPVIEDDTADLMRARATVTYNYMEIEPGARFQEPILAEPSPQSGDVYVRSAYELNSPHRIRRDEQQFLRRLQPTAPVLELVDSVPHPNRVAAHIRMATGPQFDHLSFEAPQNWPAERHHELTEWRRRSHVDRFIARLDALIAENRAETIFVSTDLEATYKTLTERYGTRLHYLGRDRFDRSRQQLRFALADLILLTAAPHFLASTWSAFSDIAQRLGHPGRKIERSGYEF